MTAAERVADHDAADGAAAVPTYVLVDGENIDATIGSMLGRRPKPDERPRWERLVHFATEQWGGEATALFFLASQGELPMSFVQALIAMGYRPVPLTGGPHEKVVDIAILRTLDEIRNRPGNVLLVSNDGDFLESMEALLGPDRQVGVAGFDEYRNHGFNELASRGLQRFDLEHHVKAFQSRLPRVRVIPIDEYDPLDFL